MLLNRLYLLYPSRRTLLTVFLSSVVGAGLVIAASSLIEAPRNSAPSPLTSPDARFVSLGKTYHPKLRQAYAAAWEEGAKQLDAGAGISAALDAVAKSWSSQRVQLYDDVLTPEFSKIVAEGANDADLTPAERTAMSAAWRGLSVGLGK